LTAPIRWPLLPLSLLYSRGGISREGNTCDRPNSRTYTGPYAYAPHTYTYTYAYPYPYSYTYPSPSYAF
jgi:hypothetical protein